MGVMLEFALGALATLLCAGASSAAPSGKPVLTVIPGGKSKKKKKPKPKSPTSQTFPLKTTAELVPRAVVLEPTGQPGMVEMRALPPPSTAPKASTAPKKKKKPPASTSVKRPARPTPPRAPGRPAPTPKSLAKPTKRAPAKAAEDLRDFLNAGGSPGSKNNRSAFVRQCQADMQRIAADGVLGPKTRQRAAELGVIVKPLS